VQAGVVAFFEFACVNTVPQPCVNSKMKKATGKNGDLKFMVRSMLPNEKS